MHISVQDSRAIASGFEFAGKLIVVDRFLRIPRVTASLRAFVLISAVAILGLLSRSSVALFRGFKYELQHEAGRNFRLNSIISEQELRTIQVSQVDQNLFERPPPFHSYLDFTPPPPLL